MTSVKGVASKAPTSSRLLPQLTFILINVTIAIIYRLLNNGPYKPHSCAIFGLNCPDWPISGRVAPGFEKVKETFRKNFEDGEEVGASFHAWMDGKPVVELTGGFFDQSYNPEKLYTDDTLQLVFSSTKAVTGIAVAHLVSSGHLSYSEKVSTYWPEFAVGNKENVTVAELMGHRGGVAYLDPDRVPSPDDILDLDNLASTIASQPHNFDGVTTVTYHATTRGWFINELVRRADPEHRSLGRYIREEISVPYGIDFHLGLDAENHSRVSPLIGYPNIYVLYNILVPRRFQKEPIPPAMLDALLKRGSLQHKVLMGSGPKFPWYELWPRGYNSYKIWMGESGSFSGMTNAKALAHLAAIMANNGTDPITKRTLISQAVLSDALTLLPIDRDAVLGNFMPFTTGGWGQVTTLVHDQTWVGWAGAGGSMIWWNAEESIAFSYVMNAVKLQALGDKRSWRVLKAFVEGVDKLRGRKGIRRRVGDDHGDEPLSV